MKQDDIKVVYVTSSKLEEEYKRIKTDPVLHIDFSKWATQVLTRKTDKEKQEEHSHEPQA
jgi:hypothetical protein